VAVAVCGLLLAGCAAKQSPPEPSTEHGSLAECLKTHGVADAGGPAAALGPPAGVDQAAWQAAMRACSALAPGPAAS